MYLVYMCICSGLKSLITPVLAGLLESDIAKMSSFEHFFATIELISKMKVKIMHRIQRIIYMYMYIHVACVHTHSCIYICS